MTILTATTLEFEAEASSENLGEIAPNSILMIMADQIGKKQVFRLNTDGIQENQTILRNTETGMCYKLVNGVWMWVPC
jgi:phosphotransferase system HPr-like phosphotransfer protein